MFEIELKSPEEFLIKVKDREILINLANYTIDAGLKVGLLEGAGEYEVYKVISVGEKVDSVKEGDTLLTYINPGHKFTYAGETYKVISISDILVVL